MNRLQAIDALMGAWTQRDSEFCVGAAEFESSDRELRDAMHALGVTDEEMDNDPDVSTTTTEDSSQP